MVFFNDPSFFFPYIYIIDPPIDFPLHQMAPALDTMNTSDVAAENQKSVKVLDELLQKLTISKTKDEATYAAENLATFINGPIEEHDVPTK